MATESYHKTETKLERIRQISASNPEMKFDSLMHHFNEESLAACFSRLDGKKATGTDRISKDDYGRDLENNLRNLVGVMKRMAYKPSPVRQVLIPKEGKANATRKLGISNFEDKLVQGVMQQVLESIYEPIFLGCSYGFRPNRGCHDAIKALRKHVNEEYVDTILDVDLENFFGSIKHEILLDLLSQKIKDQKFIRYVVRMFKAGVLNKGEFYTTDEGVPQGSICSPVLSNIMAHYVIDEWVEFTVRRHCRGKVALFRYADDLVICCNEGGDASRIKAALAKRLDKFGLKMNMEKTKMVSFSRNKMRKGEKQGSFDFLGLTFFLAKSRRGHVVAKVKTSRTRMRSKLKRVKEWIKEVRSRLRLTAIWKSFLAKLQGHVAYFGISFNLEHVQSFITHATRIVFKWLNRRSQKRSFNWGQFSQFIAANPLPKARIYLRLF